MKTGGNRVRAYKLSYGTSPNTGRSLLTSVQQYGKDATLDGNGIVTGGTALPAMQLTWSFATKTIVEQTWSTTAGSWGTAALTWVGDFNGDGKADLATASGSSIWVKRSTGSAFVNGTWSTSAVFGTSDYTWVGDFNGDGKTDIASRSSSTIRVMRSTGTSFVTETWTTSASSWGTAALTWVGDFNGDGKTDIATASGGSIWVMRSTGSSFAIETWATSASIWGTTGNNGVADFNGDGKTDIWAWSESTIYVKRSTGTSFVQETWAPDAGPPSTYSMRWVADFNGDGHADIAKKYPGTNDAIFVNHSTGNRLRIHACWAIADGSWGSVDFTWLGDFNGDGLMDVASASGGNIWIKRNNGDSFVPETWATTASNWGGRGLHQGGRLRR